VRHFWLNFCTLSRIVVRTIDAVISHIINSAAREKQHPVTSGRLYVVIELRTLIGVVSVNSDPPLPGTYPTTPQYPTTEGLSAKVRIPWDNAFFFAHLYGRDPIFPPISQQPTVGIFSTHANWLIKYRSIYWYCLLAFKMWSWYRTHHPEITHFFMPTEPKNPLFPPISQQPTVGIFSTHANRLARYQSIHWSCLLTFKTWAWCKIHHPEITHLSFGCPT
jgi:hypothetical protein